MAQGSEGDTAGTAGSADTAGSASTAGTCRAAALPWTTHLAIPRFNNRKAAHLRVASEEAWAR